MTVSGTACDALWKASERVWNDLEQYVERLVIVCEIRWNERGIDCDRVWNDLEQYVESTVIVCGMACDGMWNDLEQYVKYVGTSVEWTVIVCGMTSNSRWNALKRAWNGL